MGAYFSLAELTHSQMAVRYGLDNSPPESVLANLDRLMATLDYIRESIGVPIIITSGYRSPRVNRLVGGAQHSAHMDGRAADFIAPRFGSLLRLAQHVRGLSTVRYDQLIYEGKWLHLSIPRAGCEPRQEVLTAVFTDGHAWYSQGLP